MGSPDIYRAAAVLVREHLPDLRPHAATCVWRGPYRLPEGVVEYYREFGVVEAPLPAGGVPHRLWRPGDLADVQADWSTRVDGTPDPRWGAHWLGLISEGNVVWAFDRETDQVLWVDGRTPTPLPCTLAELIATLVASAVAHRQLADPAGAAVDPDHAERADTLTLALAAQLLGRFGPVREVLPLIG